MSLSTDFLEVPRPSEVRDHSRKPAAVVGGASEAALAVCAEGSASAEHLRSDPGASQPSLGPLTTPSSIRDELIQ